LQDEHDEEEIKDAGKEVKYDIMKGKMKMMKKKMKLAYGVAEHPPTIHYSRSKNGRMCFSPTAISL
jgi:hypothetical protein